MQVLEFVKDNSITSVSRLLMVTLLKPGGHAGKSVYLPQDLRTGLGRL